MKSTLERQALPRLERIDQLISSGSSLCNSETQSYSKHFPRFEKLVSKFIKIEEFASNELIQLIDYFSLKIEHLQDAISQNEKKKLKDQQNQFKSRNSRIAFKKNKPITQDEVALEAPKINQEGGFDEKQIMLAKYRKMMTILMSISTTKKLNISLLTQINQIDLKEIEINNVDNIQNIKNHFDNDLRKRFQDLEREYKVLKKKLKDNQTDSLKVQSFLKKCENQEEHIVSQSKQGFNTFCKGIVEKLNGYDRILSKIENMYILGRMSQNNEIKKQKEIHLKPSQANLRETTTLIYNSERKLTNQK